MSTDLEPQASTHEHRAEYPSRCEGCEHLAADLVSRAPAWMLAARSQPVTSDLVAALRFEAEVWRGKLGFPTRVGDGEVVQYAAAARSLLGAIDRVLSASESTPRDWPPGLTAQVEWQIGNAYRNGHEDGRSCGVESAGLGFTACEHLSESAPLAVEREPLAASDPVAAVTTVCDLLWEHGVVMRDSTPLAEAIVAALAPDLRSYGYDPRMGQPHRWFGDDHVGHPGEVCISAHRRASEAARRLSGEQP